MLAIEIQRTIDDLLEITQKESICLKGFKMKEAAKFFAEKEKLLVLFNSHKSILLQHPRTLTKEERAMVRKKIDLLLARMGENEKYLERHRVAKQSILDNFKLQMAEKDRVKTGYTALGRTNTTRAAHSSPGAFAYMESL